MALAYKCDRCGSFYEDPAPYSFVSRLTVIETREIVPHKIKDLCPDCTEKLRKFMDGKNDGNCETL